MGPIWVLPAPDGPHDGHMNLVIGAVIHTGANLDAGLANLCYEKWSLAETIFLLILLITDSSFMGQHGAHLGPTGPRWAPCWPHEPCYQGITGTYCLRSTQSVAGKIV